MSTLSADSPASDVRRRQQGKKDESPSSESMTDNGREASFDTQPKSIEAFPRSHSPQPLPSPSSEPLPKGSDVQTLPRPSSSGKASSSDRRRTASNPLHVQFPSESPLADSNAVPIGSSERSRINSRPPPPVITAHPTPVRSGSGFASSFKALRKKIESELSRKRTASSKHQREAPSRSGKRSARQAVGTVAALRPTPALTVPDTMSVADASQLCAAKRTDCVLVVDDEEHLCGIFTAKDLAFRVVAEGLEPRNTPVSKIMTRNPMVTRDTTSATEALQLMVSRAFRHLPVCNDEGDIVGLLDITKVFHEALDKVERSYEASQKLYSALEGVQNEFGSGMHNPQAASMMAYVEQLREKMSLPTLADVMDGSNPAVVSVKTSVRDAARMMKEHRTTAVCVMENAPHVGLPAKIAGIFTSKDIVLRVIAAGLQPDRCSVVRVMTPHPDRAPPTMTVQEALRKMHHGHYLNMPVVEDGRLLAIIDVLKLTYTTLEQINSMSGDVDQEEGGPMWGRFFGSLAAVPAGDDSESVVSGSGFPASPRSPGNYDRIHSMSEVHPNDSASAAGADSHDDRDSTLGIPLSSLAKASAAGPIVDENIAVFKFISPSQRIHRFESPTLSLDHLRDIVAGKLLTDPFFIRDPSDDTPTPDPNDFTLAYTDDDGDTVMMSADSDVKDAVAVAQKKGQSRIVLTINGGKGWEGPVNAAPKRSEPTPTLAKQLEPLEEEQEPAAGIVKADPSANSVEIVEPEKAPEEVRKTLHAVHDVVFGIPRDLVLPAAIVFTGVVVVATFVASRLGGRK